MSIQSSIVITSISGPENPILQTYAKTCSEKDIPLIIIGDRKSPENFSLEGCRYYSVTDQRKLSFKLSKLLDENSYARKNLGYLLAAELGSQVIIETDDDNLPFESFWVERSDTITGEMADGNGWLNIYSYFSQEFIWPRGFPLEELLENTPCTLSAKKEYFCPVQQGLADGNPDVDAVYRLTRKLPVEFNKRLPVVLGQNSFCPFNSQNTTWFKEVFALLYIPSTCNFRVCDIWRSFIALSILQVNEWHLGFHEATVIQHRNQHNLLNDLENEVPGILKNKQIMKELHALKLTKGKDAIPQNMRTSYERLLHLNLVEARELDLLDAWLADLGSCG